MGVKFEMGRLAGQRFVMDVSFLILLLLWGQDYFSQGSLTLMGIGVVMVAGAIGSLVIHELAHVFAGIGLGIRTMPTELHGLGGTTEFTGAKTRDVWRRIAAALAGPVASYALYFALDALATSEPVRTSSFGAVIVGGLAQVNWLYALFTLLPAFPLDGGRVLDDLLGMVAGRSRARQIVAVVGLCVAAYLLFAGLAGRNMLVLFLAVMLGLENYGPVQGTSTPPSRRWN